MDTMSEDTRLRDELAKDRTKLANERTLLSYGRTALGLLGLAAVIFKFSEPQYAMIFGSLSVTVAGFVFFWGWRSYLAVEARIEGKAARGFVSLADAD